jgi:hypothetical protein
MEVSIDIPNGFKDIKSFDVRHTPIIGAFCEKINFSSTMDRALDTKMEASPGKIVKVLIFDTLCIWNTFLCGATNMLSDTFLNDAMTCTRLAGHIESLLK